MIATRTGVNAAAASVPGAQSCEHAYAAAADDAAVMNSVLRSMPPPDEAGWPLRGALYVMACVGQG